MKVLYDTCLYIDFLRTGHHRDLFLTRSDIRYLSPIVGLELLAGTKNPQQKRQLVSFLMPYLKVGRLVELPGSVYLAAGSTLAKINRKDPIGNKNLSHDILIALSARQVGAKLLTSNRADFARIRKYVAFKVEYV